ncbi:MAG: MaoC family dehydratase N-terminal domain-containing protein [Dehalococcoidia bacterium]|jgi:acyl dehydratase
MVNKQLANTKLEGFDFPIERGKIKEFAGAICDPNLVYRDKEYAVKEKLPDVIAPVTFPMTFVFHIASENAVLEAMQKLGMNELTSVHGEIEFIYERPVYAGETLRGEISIGNIYEKPGKRGGTMTFVEHEVRIFDQADKPVVLVRNVFIEKS